MGQLVISLSNSKLQTITSLPYISTNSTYLGTPTHTKRPKNNSPDKREEKRECKREMALITEELRAKAEVYRGDEICQEKSKFLLSEVGLPRGLLPLKDIIECGYVEETGFVWLRQKKKIEHTFEKIGKLVSYAPEITAYVEKCKIKKLAGVKTKELLVWLTLTELSVEDPPTGKLICKTSSGLFRTFPATAFELEEGKNKRVVATPSAENKEENKEKVEVTTSAKA